MPLNRDSCQVCGADRYWVKNGNRRGENIGRSSPHKGPEEIATMIEEEKTARQQEAAQAVAQLTPQGPLVVVKKKRRTKKQ